MLLATDASSTAEASAVAAISEELSIEISRHGLQRGLWNKLLSPLQAWLRQRDEDESEAGIPSEALYESHPAWETLCRCLQFRQLGPIRTAGRQRHINVAETRAAIAGEERVGRKFPGTRYLHLQDSQVSLACFVKGRSCSPAINAELRRSIPFHLSNKVRPSYDMVSSNRGLTLATTRPDEPSSELLTLRCSLGCSGPGWGLRCF